ncbi:hypothetical protein [Bacillus badius]|uniref:Threonine kinase in B12 biosynthesis n=1 Tax=Bacillus badius TaxID=1455 RepID=A0ABR5AWU9_BACBA|nr:hypothetical protein [Bacillus badius]KIL79080.1 Threonine kinase in B12 biosynthesis [Bacillus badius]MED4715493.1 hypothetical protein [Bacillus badius]
MNKGMGSSVGTFGELAQGERDGQPFLFTLPVPIKSRAVFVPDGLQGVRSHQSHKKKAVQAAELALERLRKNTGGMLYLSSQIPVGKGMASSSADMTAAVRAVAASFGTSLPGTDIAKIAAAIEPTDGVMYEGINAINQQTGELLHAYPDVPELFLLGYDSGGRLNTQRYYRMKRSYSPAEKAAMKQLFDELHQGLLSGDQAAILSAATKSAALNDRLLSKPFFDLFANLAVTFGCGVIAGHSGTVIGLLFSKNDPRFLEKKEQAERIIEQKTKWQPVLSASVSGPSVAFGPKKAGLHQL